MPLRTYYAFVGVVPGQRLSILFPDFPEVATSSAGFGDAMVVAKDALATAVEGRLQDGQELPPSLEDDGRVPEFDRSGCDDWRPYTVTVDVPGRAQRINVTMEESLVGQLDLLAERTNRTRSALLADGARLIIAQARAA